MNMHKFFIRSLASTLAFVLAFASSHAQSGSEWQRKVSPSLLEQTRDGQSTSFIIVLTQQADVSDAKHIRTKEAKGEFVFQTLRQTAQQSQKSVLTYLESQQVSYRKLYIINAIR